MGPASALQLLVGSSAVFAPVPVRSPVVKKGRHRRFEEARKLKQAGPSASDLGLSGSRGPRSQDDEYAAIAEKYGVVFDDDEDESDEDADDEQ